MRKTFYGRRLRRGYVGEPMDPLLKFGVFVGIVALSGVVVFIHERSNRRRATALLGGRPQLDPMTFGQRHFGETERRGALAAELRELLANHVPFPLEGLAPDDAFVVDLRMDELDSMSTVEFVIELEKRYKIRIPDQDVQGILTFRQLVDYLEVRIPTAAAGAP